MCLKPTPHYTNINYLKFEQEKNDLANGTYRVTEYDGDINYAVLENGEVTWYSPDEFYQEVQMSMRASEAVDGMFDPNENSELYDREVYGIDPDDNGVEIFDAEDREELMDSWNEAMTRAVNQRPRSETESVSLADLLRTAMTIDPRGKTEAEYLAAVEQEAINQRNGIN